MIAVYLGIYMCTCMLVYMLQQRKRGHEFEREKVGESKEGRQKGKMLQL